MSGNVLRECIREILNEYDIMGVGDSKIKLGSGGLPPGIREPGSERGPDDESYRNMIKEFAFRIYLGIYCGAEPVLVSKYDKKIDPSKGEVQRAVERAAEYTGESIDFYRRKRLAINEIMGKIHPILSEKINELESKASEIEDRMKGAIAAGKGAIGKRKLAEIKEKIRILKNYESNIKRGYENIKVLADFIRNNYDPGFKIDEKVFQEYKGIGSSEGYKWGHTTEIFSQKAAKLRDELLKNGKMPNGHVITNDIIKAFKKYGAVGVNESYKEGSLYDLRKKTQIQDPEDFIKPDPGARPIHNKDAYEFAILVRQNYAEQSYYDDNMDFRMASRRPGGR